MHEELTPDDLRFTPPKLSQDILTPFLKEHWGIEGKLKPLSGERDQNFQVQAYDGKQYIYKIASPIEDPALVDFQIQALLHLENTDADIPVPRILRSNSGQVLETLNDEHNNPHAVRLLSYVPGVPLENVDPPSPDTIKQIGTMQGRVCLALTGFKHKAGSYFMPWDILNGLVVSHSLRTAYLKDGLDAKCAPALDRLESDSLPRMRELPHRTVHNDAHSGNVMCDPDDPATITGIIDFGDLLYRPLVVELSTSLTSIIERSPTPLRSTAALILGFKTKVSIPQEELELLYDATLARAIMTVQLLEFRVDNTDVDASYRNIHLPDSKTGLEKVMQIDRDDFLDAVQQPERRLTSSG